MQLHTIGIDLGKTVFHLVGPDPRGEIVVKSISGGDGDMFYGTFANEQSNAQTASQ